MKKIIFVVVLISALLSMTFMPIGAKTQCTLMSNIELNEDEAPRKDFWAFGWLTGELLIIEVASCKPIGNTGWYYDVNFYGENCGWPFELAVGRIITQSYHTYSTLRVTAKFLYNPPELIEDKYVDFGLWPFGTFGIGINVIPLY
jgi:hypothetical protein